jgi:hypothetical protein
VPALPRLEVRETQRFALGQWLGDLISKLLPKPSTPPGRIYWAMVFWGLILDQWWQFGGGGSGSADRRLSCWRGTWAPDLPGSCVYRAPQSIAYQWRRDGTDISGATSADYTASAAGSYSCRVTATNRAGSASQTSAPFTVS